MLIAAATQLVNVAAAQDRSTAYAINSQLCQNAVLSSPKIAATLTALNASMASFCQCYATMATSLLSPSDVETLNRGGHLTMAFQPNAERAWKYCIAMIPIPGLNP
jgi:hypothetical protein